jgi:DNA-binding response OmpR family regulator
MTPFLLMAEDEPDIQIIARIALKKAGFRVEVVSNGRELLERVAVERPDVILLDWMMPEMDGPHTCEALKANPATAGIPVIFMSAKSQGFERDHGMATGARGYIIKPFDALTLGDRIREILS